ncbi:MAG: hypothetical protein WCL04_00285 [Verrucomicrobiota bacterium]
MTFASFCLVIIAYATGLVAPGWLAARLLGWRPVWAWTAAVPLSMLFLLLGVELLDAMGIALHLGPMAAWVLAGNAALVFALWKWPPPESAPAAVPPPVPDGRWSSWLLLAGVVLLGGLAVHRGLLAPLSGFDTPFRWDFLARQMLREGSLAFYPPQSAADFRVYFHPDGFAPLVAVGYWWVYLVAAPAGPPGPEAVMWLVVAQYLGSLALAGGIAARVAGVARAGVLAAAVLAATPLFFRAVLIGQETGLTAVGLAGMTLALLRAEGATDTRALVLAGLLAGVAGLAREYGPALVACGALTLLWQRPGWRALAVFGGVAALLLAPWHLRGWVHVGNPLYGHALGGLFPVNPAAEGVMKKYHEIFGLQNFTMGKWAEVGWQLVREAGWVMLAGIPAALWLARRAGWLAGGAAMAFALWLASVGYTSGGPGYAMRVLSPGLVLLAVAAAVGLERLSRRLVARWLVTGALGATLLYGAFCAAIFPLPAEQVPFNQLGAVFDAAVPPHVGAERLLTDPQLAPLLKPGTRILTENAYAHAVLADANSGCDLVPIWSPEVAFLFDPKLSAAEQRRRLRELKITLLLLYPSSPNTTYLMESSPFYRTNVTAGADGSYNVKWRVLTQAGNLFYICEIPASD